MRDARWRWGGRWRKPPFVATSIISPIRLATANPGGERTWRWPRRSVLSSAASAISGVVEAQARSNPHALPRVAWDGRQRSLRMMRVMLSGAFFPPARPARDGAG